MNFIKYKELYRLGCAMAFKRSREEGSGVQLCAFSFLVSIILLLPHNRRVFIKSIPLLCI
jgi:hypothetical protein